MAGWIADQDNEDDEYHVPVSLLDTWAEYHRLWKEEGWTQQRIADAKGFDVPTVSLRCKLHTDLPAFARKSTLDGILDEGHLIPIMGVTLDVQSLAPWLTSKKAQTELLQELLDKHRGKTSDSDDVKKPTVKNVRAHAQRWKGMIAAAEVAYKGLDETWQARLVCALGCGRSLFRLPLPLFQISHHLRLAHALLAGHVPQAPRVGKCCLWSPRYRDNTYLPDRPALKCGVGREGVQGKPVVIVPEADHDALAGLLQGTGRPDI